MLEKGGRNPNRIQLVVLGFFLIVWIGLVAILVFSPGVYAQALSLVPGEPHVVDVVFVAALSVLIAVLVMGVLRRWRWTFWLILIAFLFGILRVPTSLFQFAGMLAPTGPGWYEALQAAVGFAQFLIALAMWAGYRNAGTWGDF